MARLEHAWRMSLNPMGSPPFCWKGRPSMGQMEFPRHNQPLLRVPISGRFRNVASLPYLKRIPSQQHTDTHTHMLFLQASLLLLAAWYTNLRELSLKPSAILPQLADGRCAWSGLPWSLRGIHETKSEKGNDVSLKRLEDTCG